MTLNYAIDIAEVPSFQELATVDADGDGIPTDRELARYSEAKALFVREGLEFAIDGRATPIAIAGSSATLGDGQGGLKVVRVEATFHAPLAAGASGLTYRDTNFSSIPGWREVIASATGGAAILASDVPARSLSDELRAYPEEMLTDPPAVATATLRIATEGGNDAPTPAGSPAPEPRTPKGMAERFAALVAESRSTSSMMLALVLAFAFGALHAMGPGHGKTIVTAHLATGGAGRSSALAVGLAVSLMHTASVLALGLVAFAFTRSLSASAVYPWLSLAAGVIVLALGVWLLVTRVRAGRAGKEGAIDHAPHTEHAHHAHVDDARGARMGLAAVAFGGGLLPSPTAVVVLLGAIALERVAFGLALVTAFSAGLAATLALLGVIVVRARSFADRRWDAPRFALLPVASAAVISLVGLWLTVRAVVAL